MVRSLKERLVEALLKNKLLTQEQLDKALKIQRKQNTNLGEVLIREGMISQKDLMLILSEELNIPPINLAKYKVDPAVIKIVPARIARQYCLLPISVIGKRLTVTMADPLNIFAIDDIKALTEYEIDLVIATEADVKDAIGKYYEKQTSDMSAILEEAESAGSLEVVAQEEIDISKLAAESTKAPIVKMVDLMLAEAIRKRASDIHIEPFEGLVRIRYRVDGALHEAFILPKKNQGAVLVRIKIMSKLDITESRIPQDGRFKIKLEGKEIDFRVSVLPTMFGGKVVLRVLDKGNLGVGLDKLGFEEDSLNKFNTALKRPFGMMLLTGPTGSGKSTTLYSILNRLNTSDRNIITVEDPIEYQIEGITQIAVNHDIGLTFAIGLRSLLRQSPDIIMVGEIRDAETADTAIKASLTGELVLSTLHTNDAAGAITRLADMGVEPFLIASSVIMTAAQRLCRQVCQTCKEEIDIPLPVLKRLGVDKEALEKRGIRHFYRGKGCGRCNHTGYYGRLGTLEVLLIDDAIRDMIVKGHTGHQIKEYAVKHGMLTLHDNMLEKFYRGDTTLEEVLRITTED